MKGEGERGGGGGGGGQEGEMRKGKGRGGEHSPENSDAHKQFYNYAMSSL